MASLMILFQTKIKMMDHGKIRLMSSCILGAFSHVDEEDEDLDDFWEFENPENNYSFPEISFLDHYSRKEKLKFVDELSKRFQRQTEKQLVDLVGAYFKTKPTKNVGDIHRQIEIYSKQQPEKFKHRVFGGFLKSQLNDLFIQYDSREFNESFEIKNNDLYGQFISFKYSAICFKKFKLLKYTTKDLWNNSKSKTSNALFRELNLLEGYACRYKIDGGIGDMDFDSQYAEALQLEVRELADLLDIIHKIADELNYSICDDAYLRSKDNVNGIVLPKREWAETPFFVRDRVVAIVKRCLWTAFGFSSKVVEALVNKTLVLSHHYGSKMSRKHYYRRKIITPSKEQTSSTVLKQRRYRRQDTKCYLKSAIYKNYKNNKNDSYANELKNVDTIMSNLGK